MAYQLIKITGTTSFGIIKRAALVIESCVSEVDGQIINVLLPVEEKTILSLPQDLVPVTIKKAEDDNQLLRRHRVVFLGQV